LSQLVASIPLHQLCFSLFISGACCL
jgi:hypothetical protein